LAWLKLSKVRNACQKHSKFAAALQIQHGAPVFIPSDTLLPLSLIRLAAVTRSAGGFLTNKTTKKQFKFKLQHLNGTRAWVGPLAKDCF